MGSFLFPNLAFVVIGVALGVFQWFILQQLIHNAWWWIIATTFGWTIGSALVMTAIPDGMDFTAGVIIGGSTGIAQWLISLHELHWAGWWIIVNVVAWTTGLALMPIIFLTGVMAGLVTGIALELLLRYPLSNTS